MAASNGEFKHESIQDRDSIVDYFNAMVEGIQNGKINFKNNNEEFYLEPQGLMNLEIKAKRSDSKSKITIKLNWKEPKNKPNQGNLAIN